jgi:predicted CoA-substrate-specific enzyme activase
MDLVYIGLDVGSASVNVVGVDCAGRMVGRPAYLRIAEFPTAVDATKAALREFLASCPPGLTVAGAGTTGSGRELNRHLIGADLTRTEIVAHAVGITHLACQGQVTVPRGDTVTIIDRIGTVIEIGGQDAKLIIFDAAGIPAYFNMNSICSAGTGEFLQQIADEAGITIGDFGRIALQSRRPVTIDSTCTVFSKRDFRHLTQKGVSLEDRLWGVCQAMVRNYLRNVAGGTPLRPPVVMQGGVAANEGVRKAFEIALGTEVIRPPYHDVLGALGMAIIVRDVRLGLDEHPDPGPPSSLFRGDFLDAVFTSELKYCYGCPNGCELTQALELLPAPAGSNGNGGRTVQVLDTLGGRCDGWSKPGNIHDDPPREPPLPVPVHRTPPGRRHRHAIDIVRSGAAQVRDSTGIYFVGIDGGSRGTKLALIRSRGETADVAETHALPTGGDAVGALRLAVRQLRDITRAGAEAGTPMVIGGFGTTGSAGELYRDIITTRRSKTSDYCSTEILAHYAWASSQVPGVGTVVDIGGNDAKIICVSPHGLEFAMNEKCAAGTGAFVEAIARRFGVPIEQFAEVALTSTNPARLAARCAVFGESHIVHKSRAGIPVPDLLMGLAYSLVRTYLADVGKGKEIRTPVVLQGGTCLNGAVQRAFREVLSLTDGDLVIYSDPRMIIGAGALGAALLAKGMYERGYDSAFKGYDAVLERDYRAVTTECAYEACPRRCGDLIALLEDGVVISGYKSIDCDFGMFDGLIEQDHLRTHMQRVVSIA